MIDNEQHYTNFRIQNGESVVWLVLEDMEVMNLLIRRNGVVHVDTEIINYARKETGFQERENFVHALMNHYSK